ncbi:hypothetical protein EJB05_47012, partial [Eragrostis curvula]
MSNEQALIDALLSFLPKDPENDSWEVVDICNGLVLCLTQWGLYVCNPATRRWTLLPNYYTAASNGYNTCAYIAFDPIMSPHYEVFKIPEIPEPPSVDKELDEDPCRLMEWPPSPWIFKVLSPGRPASGDSPRPEIGSADLDRATPCCVPQWCALCALSRFSLSSDKYQVVNMPPVDNSNAYLGKSKNQVYFGVVAGPHLRVWMLAESCGRMEWLLKYEADI